MSKLKIVCYILNYEPQKTCYEKTINFILCLFTLIAKAEEFSKIYVVGAALTVAGLLKKLI